MTPSLSIPFVFLLNPLWFSADGLPHILSTSEAPHTATHVERASEPRARRAQRSVQYPLPAEEMFLTSENSRITALPRTACRSFPRLSVPLLLTLH